MGPHLYCWCTTYFTSGPFSFWVHSLGPVCSLFESDPLFGSGLFSFCVDAKKKDVGKIKDGSRTVPFGKNDVRTIKTVLPTHRSSWKKPYGVGLLCGVRDRCRGGSTFVCCRHRAQDATG